MVASEVVLDYIWVEVGKVNCPCNWFVPMHFPKLIHHCRLHVCSLVSSNPTANELFRRRNRWLNSVHLLTFSLPNSWSAGFQLLSGYTVGLRSWSRWYCSRWSSFLGKTIWVGGKWHILSYLLPVGPCQYLRSSCCSLNWLDSSVSQLDFPGKATFSIHFLSFLTHVILNIHNYEISGHLVENCSL